MPWEIRTEDGRYCVHKKDDGSKVACHDTMEEARSHMQALYANENKSLSTDALAFDGGAIKALGDGKIAGYGILFTSVFDPDVQKEFFTGATETMTEVGDRRPMLYRHGAHPQIKAKVLGKAELTRVDEVGAFFEGEVNTRDEYGKAIYRLAEMGKLGFSTGSLSHLVSKELREQNGKKAYEIKCWPIGELSLTPTPVEPRTMAVPVKDITIPDEELDFDAVVKSVSQEEFDEQFSIDGIPAIKAFCEAVSPTSMKDGNARSRAAVDATKEFNTVGKILGEGFHSYASRLVRRTENRFLKEGREIHPATVQQVDQLLGEIGRIESAFSGVKEALQGIKNISNMSIAEQRALDTRTRSALLNFCRIVGSTPEELNV